MLEAAMWAGVWVTLTDLTIRAMAVWRERPAVVWDHDTQMWRSARLLMKERR